MTNERSGLVTKRLLIINGEQLYYLILVLPTTKRNSQSRRRRRRQYKEWALRGCLAQTLSYGFCEKKVA